MSDETENEAGEDRYVMEISGGLALIVDTTPGRPTGPAVIEEYPASDMKALERLAELNRLAALGWTDPTEKRNPLSAPVSPQEFLGVTLPRVAAQQRLDGLTSTLAEAIAVEGEAVKQIREYADVLNRAISVRQQIEDRIAVLRERLLDSHSSS